MITIYEQLRDYCDCMKLSDTTNKNYNQWIDNLINLVSIRTCWQNKPCETFLSSDREEVFEVDLPNTCGCDDKLLIYDLFYQEVKEDSLSVFILIRDGIKFLELEITQEHFTYNPYENKVYIDLSEYNLGSPCDCRNLHKVIIRYTAGYNLIPQCLLPMFCDMLRQVIEINRCDCVCETCEEEQVEEQEKIVDTIDEYIQQSIFMAYARQLETITLCKYRKWFQGLVV